MSERWIIPLAIIALGIYAAAYWSLQPNCGPGEVRARGVFMTICVKGH